MTFLTRRNRKSALLGPTALVPCLPAVSAFALASSSLAQSASPHADVLDIHHLPVGDGKIGNTPRRRCVMSCQAAFGGRGAQDVGPWIHGDTWDLSQKLHAEGRVTWPNAEFQVTPQNVLLTLPTNPQPAASPSSVPMGRIGIALNGVPIFNALGDAGRLAVAHEGEDLSNGHPQMQGEYRYHGPSPWLPNQTGSEVLIGCAHDGFGIYSIYDANGRELTNGDLDECHARTSEILWDGAKVSMDRYALTREYPDTIGWFRGTPVQVRNVGGGRRGPPPGGPIPPPLGPPAGLGGPQ
jgi:hypothetical protein